MSAIKTYTPDTLAKEIKSAVEWLEEEDCGCVTIKHTTTRPVLNARKLGKFGNFASRRTRNFIGVSLKNRLKRCATRFSN